MQAARGASLNPSADAHPDSTAGASRYRRVFVGVFLLAYAVDLLSKIVAVDRLSGRADIELVGEWLQLHLTRNPGAAFSTAETLTPVLSLFAIAASGIVVWSARRLGTTAWAVSLGLLLAGIAGNLTDRLFRAPGPLHGHVVDFLMLPNWPVFNIADLCINAGAVLIVVNAARGISLDGTGAPSRRDRAAAEEPET
ncbi:MAG: signal peptidase II [Nocardioides sp.]